MATARPTPTSKSKKSPEKVAARAVATPSPAKRAPVAKPKPVATAKPVARIRATVAPPAKKAPTRSRKSRAMDVGDRPSDEHIVEVYLAAVEHFREFFEERAAESGRTLLEQAKRDQLILKAYLENPDLPPPFIEGLLQARDEFDAGLAEPFVFGVRD